MDRLLDNWPITLLVVIFTLLVTFVGCNIANQNARIDSFERQCAEQGGHIYWPDNSGWCLDDEGRFIEVYP